MKHPEQGISLIITFLITTIMLSVVLSISTILAREIKLISNIGNSIPSFYAAESGAEKTIYYSNKEVPMGDNIGMCNICNSCNSSDCLNCSTTPLMPGGCAGGNCRNCRIQYNSVIGDKSYSVVVDVTPNASQVDIKLDVKGFYKDTSRAVQYNVTQ